MTKYYVIPLMDSNILIPDREGKNISITEYVKKYYPTLAQLEEERISIIYSGVYDAPFTAKQQEELKNNALQKEEVAHELGIPLQILAVSDDDGTYEVVTHSRVSSETCIFLDVREQPKNIYLTYYNGEYIRKVERFMKRKDFIVIRSGMQKTMKR